MHTKASIFKIQVSKWHKNVIRSHFHDLRAKTMLGSEMREGFCGFDQESCASGCGLSLSEL